MNNTISVSTKITPNYGEILIGVGAIIRDNIPELFDNMTARGDLKEYLLKDAIKKISFDEVSFSDEFQEILEPYINKKVLFAALKNSNEDEDCVVNLKLIHFFYTALWPILVNAYIDSINTKDNYVKVSINVKQSVFPKIYGQNSPDIFFDDLKAFLKHNYIVICDAVILDMGDMLLKLMIPISPKISFNPFN